MTTKHSKYKIFLVYETKSLSIDTFHQALRAVGFFFMTVSPLKTWGIRTISLKEFQAISENIDITTQCTIVLRDGITKEECIRLIETIKNFFKDDYREAYFLDRMNYTITKRKVTYFSADTRDYLYNTTSLEDLQNTLIKLVDKTIKEKQESLFKAQNQVSSLQEQLRSLAKVKLDYL